MNKKEKEKILIYLKKRAEELEKLGLKEEAKKEWDEYYNLKNWDSINYTPYQIK